MRQSWSACASGVPVGRTCARRGSALAWECKGLSCGTVAVVKQCAGPVMGLGTETEVDP